MYNGTFQIAFQILYIIRSPAGNAPQVNDKMAEIPEKNYELFTRHLPMLFFITIDSCISKK